MVEVLRTTTVTTTTHKNTEVHDDRTESRKCIYDLLTDTESSQNPSPELECGVTLESVSDDQMDHNIVPEHYIVEDPDGDRKDSNTSNTSNMTNISTLTTDTNYSTISETSNTSDNMAYADDKSRGTDSAMGFRRRSCADQFSLIENYPPKERRKLQNELDPNSGTASDTSGSGPSPPPIRAPPSAAMVRPPPSAKLSRQGSMKLSRQNSVVGLKDVRQHKHTMSLSHLEDDRKKSAKPSRSAITP